MNQSIDFFSYDTDTSRAGDKYETMSVNNGYSKYMKLKIRKIASQDFGSYRCVAKNSLGETDGYIKLDGKKNLWKKNFKNFIKNTLIEIPAPTTVSTTESYYRNSKHKKPYPMPNDFGVEELKENGELYFFSLFHKIFT